MASRWGPFTAFWVVLAAGLAGGPRDIAAQTTITPLPVATDARIGGDDKETRLIVDLTRKVDLRAFTLADPYRVVVDIPQTVFQLPPKSGDSGRGLIKAYRYGLVMAGGSRIVIDAAKPVRIDKAFVLDAKDGQPARLVLDLVATDRDSFMRNLAIENKTLKPLEIVRKNGKDKEPAAQAAPDPRPIVVVDPGHGGPDTGAKAAGGEIEKDIVLEFSFALRDQLEKSGKYRVIMTRTDDTFIPLNERVLLARQRQASLLISVHADSVPKGENEAQGATVYTLSEKASDGDAARLAEAENKSDMIAGIDLTHEPGDVADILIDLAQRETKIFSQQFARTLVGELKGAVRLHKHPLKSASFVVLKAPDVPSVLLELGYMTNKRDMKVLTSETWRTKTAETIAQAVDQFFRKRVAGTAPAGR